MKSIRIKFIYIIVCFLSFSGVASPVIQTDDSSFDVDGCFYGESGSWTGACSCYPFYNKSGAYCNEEERGTCSSVNGCDTGFYCNVDLNTSSCVKKPKEGRCFRTIAYSEIKNQKRFIISRSLMNWESAVLFCKALGPGWRLATRIDLDCQDNGPGCIENKYLSDFQKKAGIRGFLWLDKAKGCHAYYMDLNDGNIYNMNKNLATINQALCLYDTIKEE